MSVSSRNKELGLMLAFTFSYNFMKTNNEQIAQIVKKQNELRTAIDAIVFDLEN